MNTNSDLLNLISSEDGTEKMINECLSVVLNSTRIIIFGAGVGGRQFITF